MQERPRRDRPRKKGNYRWWLRQNAIRWSGVKPDFRIVWEEIETRSKNGVIYRKFVKRLVQVDQNTYECVISLKPV